MAAIRRGKIDPDTIDAETIDSGTIDQNAIDPDTIDPDTIDPDAVRGDARAMYALAPAPGSSIAIVGGCGGIGRAVVAAAQTLGLRALVLDLPASLATHPAPVPAIGIDVTDGDSVAAAFRRVEREIGPLHALVNLAGFAPARISVEQTDPETWAGVIDANLSGAYRVARAALPLLRAAATADAPSAIVHVASGLATRLMPGHGAYGASKAGMIALTKALAVENAPLVRANAVAPGAVRTEFLQGGLGRAALEGTLDETAYVKTIPMRRMAEPADVVGPIFFLCAPASIYMTGQTLWINGGALTP